MCCGNPLRADTASAVEHQEDNAVIKSVFHVNINVKNFERSLEFYKMLGFKVVLDIGEGPNKGNDKGLNIPDSRARAALLALSDDPRATRIDLIEWKQPKTEGAPYPHLYHVGAARIALFTKGLDEEYQRLKANGVEMVSEPVTIRFASKAGAKFFCFKDPDGTFLELIEPFNE
jgi:glyoxylase I family protein